MDTSACIVRAFLLRNFTRYCWNFIPARRDSLCDFSCGGLLSISFVETSENSRVL